MALTRTFEKISLSVTYDGLTVYLRERKPALASTLDELAFYHLPIQRLIKKNHPDHALYHSKATELAIKHWHFKFRNRLNVTQLENALGLFVRHGLLTSDEMNELIYAFVYRYLDAERELLSRIDNLTHPREIASTVIAFIHDCPYNDVLAHLHHFLWHSHFASLRDAPSPLRQKGWVTLTLQGQYAQTTEYWGRIEKALGLQMMHNLLTQCPDITLRYLAERAQQLTNEFRSFALKRRDNHLTELPKISRSYLAFLQRDQTTIQQKLERSKAYAGMQLP